MKDLIKGIREPLYYSNAEHKFLTATLNNDQTKIELKIPKGKFSLICEPKYNGKNETITLECNNHQLTIHNKPIHFNDILECSHPIYPQMRKIDTKCAINGQLIEIYNQFEGNRIKYYESCFEEIKLTTFSTLTTHWTKYVLRQAVAKRIHSKDRPKFHQGKVIFNGINVDRAYKMDPIKSNIVNKKISRGHLMAAADTVLETERIATFMYINVMPQFKAFNSFNWNNVEFAVRKIVDTIENDLIIFTGVHGTMGYKNNILYIFDDKNESTEKQKIPVPEIFYKMVINEKAMEGIVIIGVNDIFASATTINRYIHCNDVSEKNVFINNYINSNERKNIQHGYIYACNISDFLKGFKMDHYHEFKIYENYKIFTGETIF